MTIGSYIPGAHCVQFEQEPQQINSLRRIMLGHYQWRELYGYLVHPSIPLTTPGLRIADVATGTG